ncbi:MAG: peptidylprolyl isomerase [Nanoarchaeota archaeon]|nr:peptidylprolyl isomerase [DPANN group archaeon]MBL7116315.1 peptidylprolyl isomerase [Nanoarchaeota archaeon]
MAKKKRGRTSSTRKSSKKTKRVTKKQPKKNIYPIIGIIAIVVIIIVAKYSGIEAETKGKVVGVVNGELIYEEELLKEASRLPPQLQQVLDENTVLSQLIDKKLLQAEARKAGTEVDNEINRILAENNITIEQLSENVATQGFTLEEFKDQLRVFLFLNETLFYDLEVSDEEIFNYYELNPELFTVPESVRARHILISTESRTDEEALAIMDEVKTAFEEDKEKFCELVEEYSEDPGSKDTCGEYPAFTRDSNFVQEYKDTAFNNEVGEASVVKTQFGYHLIQTLEKTPERTFSLEEVEGQLKTNLLFEKQKEKFRVYIEELRSNAEIINCFETPETEICIEEEETTEEPLEEDSIVTFAKCLSEKGAKMFGAYWCSHCAAQKRMFGDAWEHITYVECSIEGNPRAQTEICRNERISGYPTWEVNGQKHTGEQTLDNLAKLSGCVLT